VLSSATVWIAKVAGTIAGFMAMREQDGYLDQLFTAMSRLCAASRLRPMALDQI